MDVASARQDRICLQARHQIYCLICLKKPNPRKTTHHFSSLSQNQRVADCTCSSGACRGLKKLSEWYPCKLQGKSLSDLFLLGLVFVSDGTLLWRDPQSWFPQIMERSGEILPPPGLQSPADAQLPQAPPAQVLASHDERGWILLPGTQKTQ